MSRGLRWCCQARGAVVLSVKPSVLSVTRHENQAYKCSTSKLDRERTARICRTCTSLVNWKVLWLQISRNYLYHTHLFQDHQLGILRVEIPTGRHIHLFRHFRTGRFWIFHWTFITMHLLLKDGHFLYARLVWLFYITLDCPHAFIKVLFAVLIIFISGVG